MSGDGNGMPKAKYRKTGKVKLKPLPANSALTSEEVLDALSLAWSNRKSAKHESSGIELCQEPFCHCILPNFIPDEDRLAQLHEELLDLEFKEKNNDLYKFHQSSEDLKSSKASSIISFRNLLQTEVKSWLIKLTGIPLNDTVDAFCARYSHTDTLLCHDDELEGRRIAYIYYLVDNWTVQDGGALDLFSVDENIQPNAVVKSIMPARNNFVLFEVSPGSFHQVCEVLSEDRTRLSISGWFHGPPIDRPASYLEKPRPLHPYGDIDDETFFDWINPVYLSPGCQGDVQEKFENDSEIELQDFLQKEKYESLLEALQSSKMCWKDRGPASKRCYKQGDDENLPEVVETCLKLFKSDAMFLLLSNLTGLKLHELAAASSSSSSDSEMDGNEVGASTSTDLTEQSSNAKSTAANNAESETCVEQTDDTSTTNNEAENNDKSEITNSQFTNATDEASNEKPQTNSEAASKDEVDSKSRTTRSSEMGGESYASNNTDESKTGDFDGEGSKVTKTDISNECGGTHTEASKNKSNESNDTGNTDASGTDAEMECLCPARCRTEVRCWCHKSYTLMHDTDTEGSEFALDLMLYLGCNDWEMHYGGFTTYIAKGEDEELLTVLPRENSLALVYRDQETMKFVKYLNSQVNSMHNKGFYDISAVYYE